MAVTYTFSTQSGSIPLAQLDANFATPITIGNTSVQLGNTITTLNNITLANTTISSGNVTLTNVSVTTANVTTANITNAVIGTANVTTANITSGVIATANITTGNVGTLTLTNALGTSSGGTGLTSFTSGGVVYASSGSALSTGSALTFDGTNLGIGTTSPSQKLDVRGSIYVQRDTNPTNAVALQLTNQTTVSNNGCRLSFDAYNVGSSALGVPSDSASLAFYTGGVTTERMRLDSSGNLGLGVTPSAWGSSKYVMQLGARASLYGASNLTVLGNNYYDNGTNNIYIATAAATDYYQSAGSHVWRNAPSGTAGNAITFTQAMTLDASGYLTIPAVYGRTVTTPRNVFIDSSGNLGGISSIRASKTNISQLNSASWIYELNPVTFNYLKKDEEGEYLEEFEEEQQFGLIAEEVELVKPELCIYTDDKVSGIHYDRMIAPLIKAIQELKASNDALTARIAQLEAK
jgi:hypothetical protein